MDGKDVTARTLPLPSRRNRRCSAAISAVVAVAALILGGCDGGESPQGPYQPGIGGNGGGYIDDDSVGGGGPGRFNPPPVEGPYSPGRLDSPYN